MNSRAEPIYNTSAFAPRLGQFVSTAATTQHADAFARSRLQPTAYSRVAPIWKTAYVEFEDMQFGERRVILTYQEHGTGLPAWTALALRSLSERRGLEPGWDGYDAKPTDARHAGRLFSYLFALMHDTSTPPLITPLSDGGVQAEWHGNNRDLEIVVPADGPSTYYYYDGSDEEEDELDSNLQRVRTVIAEF
jgi:hypothetical protein